MVVTGVPGAGKTTLGAALALTLRVPFLSLDSIKEQLYSRDDTAGAYLLRMANNLATDRQIAALRRSAREAGWHEVQPQGAEHPDPERQLVSADEWARLNALLGSMPEAMHRALVMFRVEGMRQQAIAEELGMSVSGVEKLLARAYRRLVEFRNDSNAVAATSQEGDPDGRSTSNG